MRPTTNKLLPERERTVLIILSIAAAITAALAYISTTSAALEVHFMDVGQGDATFIQTPEHYQILVDGGPKGSDVLRGLSKTMPFYDRSIDLIVATHLDVDHIGGLIAVMDSFKVDAVLVSQTKPNSPAGEKFFKMAEEKNVKLVKVQAGDSFVFDNDIRLTVLFPEANTRYLSDNNMSVVTKLVYNKDSFLLTGDIEKRAEIALAQNIDISAEVLKVAHHGSKTSSNNYFLEKVNPKLAVIQVGENRYGHPHATVLKRLQSRGIQILRNDKNGVISMYSYGNSI